MTSSVINHDKPWPEFGTDSLWLLHGWHTTNPMQERVSGCPSIRAFYSRSYRQLLTKFSIGSVEPSVHIGLLNFYLAWSSARNYRCSEKIRFKVQRAAYSKQKLCPINPCDVRNSDMMGI